MRASLENRNRIFQGKTLPLVDILEIERSNPGRPALFEVVKGDGLHRFRYGFQIAGKETPAAEMTNLIQAYRRTFPGAKLYLSQGR